MAKVIATCSECGDIELRSRDITLRTCTDSWVSEYVFPCPECHLTQIKWASDEVIDLLISVGVRSVEWSLPAEIQQRSIDLTDPTIDLTIDDLIDWHGILQQDDFGIANFQPPF